MAGVTPLKGQEKAPRPERPHAESPGHGRKGADQARPSGLATPTAGRLAPRAEFAFDRAIDRALSRGRRMPEAKLDLHGMTLAAAERAVSRFLEEAAALDLRLVLIVTGKGLREVSGRITGGRIREEFPAWLNRVENRAKVRGLKPAHPRHGGSGAFYVLLRRRPPT